MATRKTMNISLTRRLEKFVQSNVESGRYQTASEVVRESLRMMEERASERKTGLRSVRRKIAVGLRQLDRGHTIEGEEAFQLLLDRRRKPRRKAG